MATRSRTQSGMLVGVAILTSLALAGLGSSPVSAMSRTGVALPGDTTIVVQPDPCVPQPQVLGFAPEQATVVLGASTSLRWSVQVPAGCNYLLVLGGQVVGPEGTLPVQPQANTTYTLTLSWGPNRTLWTSANTKVEVALPADPADPSRNKVTITTPSLPLLVQALRTENTTVVIDNAVELDLGHLDSIYVASGVRLMGGRSAVPGKPFAPGPLLYTTTRPRRLFDIQGAAVRISGLRIQGTLRVDPPEIASTDDDSSIGISISPNSRGSVPIEIDHNEIYGFSGAAIEVLGDGQELTVQSWFHWTSLITYPATPEPAYIHDNFIHHNLHEGKMGYGVCVSNGSHALIERNVFDWNRHAIAGDGSDFSGYRAYRNLVLAHGGYDTWMLGTWHFTHQFDMHGQSSYCLDAFADRDCGTAGHDIDIRHNSFSYTAGTAIKVRGTPQLEPYGAVISSNVFAHDSMDDAVDWTEGGVWLSGDNQVGATFTATDACDFDGDGVSDRFLTTGQTWWYASDSGRGPWVYVNTSTLTVQDVTLGDSNGDALCDVSAGGVVYSWRTANSRPLLPIATTVGNAVYQVTGSLDTDGDGIVDEVDNCTLIPNLSQLDADHDGFGNACDADLNNDNVVNFVDLARLKQAFFTADPAADLNGDGVVNFADLAIMKRAVFGKPGPAAGKP